MKVPDDIRKKFGATFLARRESKHLSQEEIAASIGTSQQTVWKWENGILDQLHGGDRN